MTKAEKSVQKEKKPVQKGKKSRMKVENEKVKYYSKYHDDLINYGLSEKETKKVIQMLDYEKDHRSIDSDFFSDFCPTDDKLAGSDEKVSGNDEKLHWFYKKVLELSKSDDSQDEFSSQKKTAFQEKPVICFRGDKISIYKNNHVLWDISKTKDGKYAVEFDFDHARYCPDWSKILNRLCGGKSSDNDLGFSVHLTAGEKAKVVDTESGMRPVYRLDANKKKTDLVTGGTIGTIRTEKESFSKEFVDETFEIFSSLIASFMSGGEDQFRNRMRELAKKSNSGIKMAENIQNRGTTPYIEKRWQQRLFNHFKKKEKDSPWIFAYDLELSQRYPNKDIRKKLIANEPDLMAVRFDKNGKAEKLLMIEVKSTYSACWQVSKGKHTSDLWSHVEGMKKYSDMTFFIDSRIEDAHKLLKHYLDMKLYPDLDKKLYPDLTEENVKSVQNLKVSDVERVILFTNDNYPEKKASGKNSSEKKKSKSTSAIDFLNNTANKQKLKQLIDEKDPQCKIWTTNSNYFDEEIKIDYAYSLF